MGAITDLSEIENVQRQIGQSTPPVPEMAQTAGAIVAPAELAHVRTQLAAPEATGDALPAIASPSPALPQGQTFMGPRPDRGIGGAIEDGIRMLVAPMMGDRAAAAIDTATGTGLPNADYAKNLANERAKTEWAQSAHPLASQVLGGVGSIAPASAAMAAAPEEGLLGGATLLGRSLYSALVGSGSSGLAAASKEPDLTAPGTAGRVGGAMATGALGGAAAPMFGAGLGAAYNAAGNALAGTPTGISRAAASQILPALRVDTPNVVGNNLTNWGPSAMLADAGPSLTGVAQGTALNSTEGLSIAKGALDARSNPAEISRRVSQDVTNTLGPARSAQVVSDALESAKAPHSANLTQAFASAPPVNVQQIVDNIDRIKTAEGTPLRSALGSVRTALTQDMGPDASRVPVDDAETLDRARQHIDSMINWAPRGVGPLAGADASSQGIIGNIRDQLSQTLKAQVPGYEDSMNGLSAINRAQENIATGLKSLRGGQASVDPEDFANQYGALPHGPVQPGSLPPRTPEQAAQNIGMRSFINKALLANPNDAVAIKRLLQGEEGANSQNIGTAFGPEARSNLQDVVDRESAIASTHNQVVGNAMTALRQAAAKRMDPSAAVGGTPIIYPGSTVGGVVGTLGKKAFGAMADALKADPTAQHGEIARIMTSQGPQRDAYYSALVDALTRRNAIANQAATVGKYGAHGSLAAALIANRAFGGL